MNKNKNKINLRNHEFVRKKQNGRWKWFYFSFYNPSCFLLWSELIRVQFYFIFIFLFDPSWFESIRVDPTRTGGPSWSSPTFVPASKSISNQGTFCNFSLAPKGKIYKTSMKHLKIHKFPLKNVIVLAIECKMYPAENSAKSSLTWLHFKTDHGFRREENKFEFLEGRFLDEKLPFLHKRKLSILLNFLFPFFVF